MRRCGSLSRRSVVPKFTDTKEREWIVAIDVTTVVDLRNTLEFDILSDDQGQMVLRLEQDPVLLANVLFVVCQDQAKLLKVDSREFGRGLCGPPIGDATAALIEALADFSQSPKAKQNLRATFGLVRRMLDRGRTAVEKRLGSGAVEKAVEEALTQFESSSSAPAAAASSHGDSLPGS
jgi:hypothetical protein